jgi:hypothetical protein
VGWGDEGWWDRETNSVEGTAVRRVSVKPLLPEAGGRGSEEWQPCTVGWVWVWGVGTRYKVTLTELTTVTDLLVGVSSRDDSAGVGAGVGCCWCLLMLMLMLVLVLLFLCCCSDPPRCLAAWVCLLVWMRLACLLVCGLVGDGLVALADEHFRDGRHRRHGRHRLHGVQSDRDRGGPQPCRLALPTALG